ncbi:MAG: phosphatase PAP2 family protein [Phycisphaerae bacterium]|nr:phosphatase PAP2 family protein [Gemmatimonadaceae bacterium]
MSNTLSSCQMRSPLSLPLLARLDAHDRALLARLVLAGGRAQSSCRTWRALTHLGGTRFSIAVTFALLAFAPDDVEFFLRAALALTLSHLMVRCIKRHAERARPTESMTFDALVVVPDKFSFPSGHACAAMSVAIFYSVQYPAWGPLIFLLAFIVGTSRIALGVHYPGDVLAGQLIAIVVGFVLMV